MYLQRIYQAMISTYVKLNDFILNDHYSIKKHPFARALGDQFKFGSGKADLFHRDSPPLMAQPLAGFCRVSLARASAITSTKSIHCRCQNAGSGNNL